MARPAAWAVVVLMVALLAEPSIAGTAMRRPGTAHEASAHRLAGRVRALAEATASGENLSKGNGTSVAPKTRNPLEGVMLLNQIFFGVLLIVAVADILVNHEDYNIYNYKQFGDSNPIPLTPDMTDSQKKRITTIKQWINVIVCMMAFFTIISGMFINGKEQMEEQKYEKVRSAMAKERKKVEEIELEHNLADQLDGGDKGSGKTAAVSLLQMSATEGDASKKREFNPVNKGLWDNSETVEFLLKEKQGNPAKLVRTVFEWFDDHPGKELPNEILIGMMVDVGYDRVLSTDMVSEWDAGKNGGLSLTEVKYLQASTGDSVNDLIFTGTTSFQQKIFWGGILASEFMLVTTNRNSDRNAAFIGLLLLNMTCFMMLSKSWHMLSSVEEASASIFEFFQSAIQTGLVRILLMTLIVACMALIYNQALGRCLPGTFVCGNNAVPICISTGFPPESVRCRQDGKTDYHCPNCDQITHECAVYKDQDKSLEGHAMARLSNTASKLPSGPNVDNGDPRFAYLTNTGNGWNSDAVCLDEKPPVQLSIFDKTVNDNVDEAEIAEAFLSPVCREDAKGASCNLDDRVVAYALAGAVREPTSITNLLRRVDSRTAADWPPKQVALSRLGNDCAELATKPTELAPSVHCKEGCPNRKYSAGCHSTCGSCVASHLEPRTPPDQLCTSCPFGMYMTYKIASGENITSCFGTCSTERSFQKKPLNCQICDECDPTTRVQMPIMTPEHSTGTSTYNLCYRRDINETDPWFQVKSTGSGNETSSRGVAISDWQAVVMVGQPAACGGVDCSRSDMTDTIGNGYLDSLYFSLVTHTTIGYGDISPTSKRGYLAVILHALLMIVFGFL